MKDSTVSGNGEAGVLAVSQYDVFAKAKIAIKGSTIDGNLIGVRALGDQCNACDRPLEPHVSDSIVTGNALFGVVSEEGRVKLRGVTATGNGTDAQCGVSISCADISARIVPAIDRSTVCDTSYDSTSGFPGTSRGICASD